MKRLLCLAIAAALVASAAPARLRQAGQDAAAGHLVASLARTASLPAGGSDLQLVLAAAVLPREEPSTGDVAVEETPSQANEDSAEERLDESRGASEDNDDIEPILLQRSTLR
mmetsp:Transcript_36164/g.78994  ORF Transcript_36164/g.78994 Transcript_36164/m.78994 type:complete len:113 (-) Transcript_36164:140-478(-)